MWAWDGRAKAERLTFSGNLRLISGGFAAEEVSNYWFGFGTDDPAGKHAVGDIIVQFGFARSGSNRRYAAVFARDEHDAIWIMHSGGIGGGRPGIGRNAFLDAYNGSFAYVNWLSPKAKAEYARIAPLEAPDLMQRVAAFTFAVRTFKDSVVASASGT